MGSQRAIVWRDGAIAAGPLYGDAIDQALRLLGVEHSGDADEFDTLGLGRHRQTNRWAAETIVDEFQQKADGPVPGLVEALNFEHDSRELKNLVRSGAANRLESAGEAASEAAPALARSARGDADYGVRLTATCALAGIGSAGVPLLIELLADSRITDHWPAAFALGKVGPQACEAVPALVRVLGDADYRARGQAAETLGEIGPAAQGAVAALIAALADPQRVVRCEAARALGKIGPAATEASAALEKLTHDEDKHVRQAAEEALARLRG